MNSVVGPIFNESFVGKRCLWVPCGSHWNLLEVCWNALLKQKKKKKKKGQNADIGKKSAESKWVLNKSIGLEYIYIYLFFFFYKKKNNWFF